MLLQPILHSIPIVVVVLSMWASAAIAAERASRIKLATLAPKGSLYHRVLQEMGQAWRLVEGDDSRFVIYTDGSQGGEADVVRRMRVGQLNAAMMSVVGLSEIEPSVAVLQKLPFVYRSWDELDHIRESLGPELEKRLYDKGFKVLFWVEAGWVRFFSTQPVATPEDIKPLKMFAWAGDPALVRFAESLGYRPVVLETADMFPALQTGMVDVVPVTPMFALAAQVDTLAPYMLDIEWAPIVGATVVTRKVWESMSAAGRAVLGEHGDRAAERLRANRSRLDTEAIAAMERRGLEVRRSTPEIRAVWRQLSEDTLPELRGHTIPPDVFDAVRALLAAYRRASPGQ